MLRLFIAAGVLGVAASNASAALFLHDPFAYTPGQLLDAQTAPNGRTWDNRGPSADTDRVIIQDTANFGGADANLSYAFLPASAGEGAAYGGAGNSSAIELLDAAATTGTFYYSFLMRVNALGGLTTGGGYLASFNNSQGDNNTQNPTVAGGRLVARTSGAGYEIGVERQSGNTNNFVFAPGVHAVGETVFVVVSYEFVPGGTANDIARLWVNPDSLDDETTPNAVYPTGALGTDLTQLWSFFFRQGSDAAVPGDLSVDELRLGDTWASVAPVPEPASIAVAAVGAFTLAPRRRRASRAA